MTWPLIIRSALYLDMRGASRRRSPRHGSFTYRRIADGETANYGGTYRTRDFPEARVPHYDIATTLLPSKTPTGASRAPFSNVYAFAEQSFLCELAATSGRDYCDFLIDLLGEDQWFKDGDRNSLNTGRAKGVVNAACASAGWGRDMPKGRGLGLAFFFSHAGHVAELAEVSVCG